MRRQSHSTRRRYDSSESESEDASDYSSDSSGLANKFTRFKVNDAPTFEDLGYDAKEVVTLEIGTNDSTGFNLVFPFYKAKDLVHADKSKRNDIFDGVTAILSAPGSEVRVNTLKGKLIRNVAHPVTGKSTSAIEVEYPILAPFFRRNRFQITDALHRHTGYVDGSGEPYEAHTPFINGLESVLADVAEDSEDEGEPKKGKLLYILPPTVVVSKDYKGHVYSNDYYNSQKVTDEAPDALHLLPDFMREEMSYQNSLGQKKTEMRLKFIAMVLIPIEASKASTAQAKKSSNADESFFEFFEKKSSGKRGA